MYFDTVERQDWITCLEDVVTEANNQPHLVHPDKFAWTFNAKADAMNLWEHCVGWYDANGHIMGAIVVRHNKRQPVANLQLLHTFNKHRRKGVGRVLTEHQFEESYKSGMKYFRVSAEIDAVPFYKALGFKFWGEQKSGCQLSIFKIGGPTIAEGQYDIEDPIINRAIYTKARGGLVKVFEGGPC